jgi:diacylglycerol kinase family enzyme
VSNPFSGGNKKGMGAIRAFLARNPTIHHMEAVTPTEVGAALAEFYRRNVDLLVVNGGDGTVQAVLTTLFARPGAPPPPLLALLRAGTASMLARDVGVHAEPVAGLEKICAWSRESGRSWSHVHERPVLRVSREDGTEPLCGMFFGAGAIPLGIDICHGSMNPKKRRGELMPGLILARLALAVLTGNTRLVPPTDMEIRLDETQTQRNDYLFAMISTLERLFLGLHPFWGEEAAPLHFTALKTKPPRLLRNLPSLLLGRRTTTTTPENGYYSHNNSRIVLDFRGRFTLDGEIFETLTPLTIEAAGPARFLKI